MRKKTLIIVITIIIIALVGGAIYSVLSAKNKKENHDDSINEFTQNNGIVNKIEGNTELSEDRKNLLDENIVRMIDMYVKGSLAMDDKGYFLTNENRELYYENKSELDYSNYKQNLIVIINALADEGYTKEAILQVQKFYFQFAESLTRYDKETMFIKLKQCFPRTGTNQQSLTDNASSVFGIMGGDGFKSIFTPTVQVVVEIPKLSEVAPYTVPTITEEQEKICIYDMYINPTQNDYEGHLESFLHIIIHQFGTEGYTEDEIILAQLVYTTGIFDAVYTPDYILKLMTCIPKGEVTFESLKNSVMIEFNTDISKRA